EEVERMLLDSFSHAESDVNLRLLTEQRVEADRILMATRAAMESTPSLLTEDDKVAIERAMVALERAKAGDKASPIKAAIEALDLASKDFAQRRMNRAIGAGFAGRRVSEVEVSLGTAGPGKD
ncbi:MAG TPA: Hsp70 family protein, partial [Polyangia bacterium]